MSAELGAILLESEMRTGATDEIWRGLVQAVDAREEPVGTLSADDVDHHYGENLFGGLWDEHLIFDFDDEDGGEAWP